MVSWCAHLWLLEDDDDGLFEANLLCQGSSALTPNCELLLFSKGSELARVLVWSLGKWRGTLADLARVRRRIDNGVHMVRVECALRGRRERDRCVGEQETVPDPAKARRGRLCIRLLGQRAARWTALGGAQGSIPHLRCHITCPLFPTPLLLHSSKFLKKKAVREC